MTFTSGLLLWPSSSESTKTKVSFPNKDLHWAHEWRELRMIEHPNTLRHWLLQLEYWGLHAARSPDMDHPNTPRLLKTGILGSSFSRTIQHISYITESTCTAIRCLFKYFSLSLFIPVSLSFKTYLLKRRFNTLTSSSVQAVSPYSKWIWSFLVNFIIFNGRIVQSIIHNFKVLPFQLTRRHKCTRLLLHL